MRDPSNLTKVNVQIYEEASEWIVKHRTGELDFMDRQAFDAWLRTSPEHVRAYLEMSAVREDVSSLYLKDKTSADELIAKARTADNVVAWEKTLRPDFVRRSKAGCSSASSAERGRGLPRRSLLAAGFAVVCVGASLYAWMQREPTYSTAVGEQRSITLEDGSNVDLNAHSRIRIRFSQAERDVELLEGQALFRVAKDKARPFLVRSAGAIVRAVGTQFDVYRKNAGTIVTVVEGRVLVLTSQNIATASATANLPAPISVAPPLTERDPRRSQQPPNGKPERYGSGAIVLSAGEQVRVTSRADPVPQQTDIAAATSWTQHRLIFDVSPLSEVAEEFNRYNTRRLVIADPDLSDFRISGVFSAVDPELLLQFLRSQPEIRVEEREKEIRIFKR